MRVFLSFAFVVSAASLTLAACSDAAATDEPETSSSSSSSSGEPSTTPDDDAGPGDQDASESSSSGGPVVSGCEVLVDQANLEGVSEDERTQPSPVCRDAWIDQIVAGTTGGDSIDTACFDCVENPGFDPGPFVTGCLAERGETGDCLDEVGLFERCITAACDDGCDGGHKKTACLQHAAKNQCGALAAHPSCSAQIAANLSFCNSIPAYKLMCGGKPAVGTCSDLAQQGQDVTPTEGTTPPAFAGGTVAEGTYVATAVQGYGSLWDGLDGRVKSETIRVAGAQLSEVAVAKTTQAITSQGGAFSVSGTTLTWNQSCPQATALPFHFTATTSTLVLGFGFETDAPNDGFVVTYTKL